MQKLLLLSGLVAVIAIPILTARDPNPRRGIKRAVVAYLVFNFVYVLSLMYIYPRLGS